LYYGVLNNDNPTPADINNPTSYQWFRVTDGFGTTKFLFFSTFGGRQIQFRADATVPNTFFRQVSSTAIDLDFVLSSQALPQVIITAFQRSNTAPATPTGGTYNFSTLSFTPPAGWGNSVPSGNTPFYTSQNTFIAPVNGNISAPSLAWTTPVLTGQNGNNGVSVFQYTVYQQSAATPPTPSGGSYNFTTGVGTPPIGWLNTPVSTSNNSIFSSTAQAYSNTANGIWIGNASSWSAPVQFTGAGGSARPRGPVPMAYVVTAADPTVPPGNNQGVLTTSFSASRTNITAPIGTGLSPPVNGDTANFTWASNAAKNAVYTYSTASGWQLAVGQVINGNVFVTGSVNASALNANDIYALTMRGGAVTPGVYSGNGYWLEGNSGNAYIGGNLKIGNNANVGSNLIIGNSASIGNNLFIGGNANIGNNLFIGTNATIGSNLNVTGLITTGNLQANTVRTNTIVNGAVSGGQSFISEVDQIVFFPVQNQTYYSNLFVNVVTIEPNQSVYIFGDLGLNIETNNVVGTQVQPAITYSISRRPSGTTSYTVIGQFTIGVQLIRLTSTEYTGFNLRTWSGIFDTVPTIGSYDYVFGFSWAQGIGSYQMYDISFSSRLMLLQTLKK